MAGAWIKAEKSTMAKPELFKMARVLDVSRYEIYGMLMHFWMWADDLTVDGHVDGIVDADVDALVGHEGFAQALIDVGWLEQTRTNSKKPSINIPNFSRHMSESAKKRAVKSERQSRYRNKQDENNVDGSVDGSVDGQASTDASTREEKNNKEEKKKEIVILPYDSPGFLSAWKGYIESRKLNKIKTTDHAKKLLIKKINDLTKTEAHAIALLNEATTRGWRSIFPINGNFPSETSSDPGSSKHIVTAEEIEIVRRQRGEI